MNRGSVPRVTYVANIRFPTERAHGVQVARMCEAFQRIGVSAMLLHPVRHQPAALRGVDALEYYGVRERFAILALPNVDIFQAEPWMSGGVFTVAQFAHAAAWAWFAARRAEALAPADVFMTRDATVAAALARRRLPTVLEVHKAPERWSLRLLRHVVESPSLRLLVTMTAALRETLVSRGIDGPHTVVLHDAVDLQRYDSTAEPPWPAGPPVVLYAGQLFREKGVDTLVAAARELDGQVRVKIAGGIPQHVDDWRARLAREGPPNVEFLGHLPPLRIPALQRGADLLVLPNSGRHPHSARYTSPMKLFEYMAAGRPIIASDVAAIREVLRHDENAFLVPPDDAAALADAVRLLMSDERRRQRLAGQARADVCQYSWPGRARAIAEAAGLQGCRAASA